MKILSFFWICLTLSLGARAVDLLYYLGKDTTYNPSIPTPEEALGYQVGEWHVRHDQLAAYMSMVAENSDRVQKTVIGKTHEQRPLIQLIISSPENLADLDGILQRRATLIQGGNVDLENLPLVVWLGYSVHGNEPSGANASLLMAYYLAAANGIDQLLKEVVVVLDPCLNPDGLSRFAQWANMHKGKNLVADPNHREHVEGWPSGRTNHYWFDLNRDWLLLQHPESRARIQSFHRWNPNILTDFHEMGSNSTYFFQPGIPTRQNPLTPAQNFDLTQLIARYHAKAFDEMGELYFSQQSFDDFYYGKGSTYPDIQGSIGILFEQGSTRGHLQENSFGTRSFPETIRNQVLTSKSSLRAGLENRQKLLAYQRDFFKKADEDAAADHVKAYAFGSSSDPARVYEMARVLRQHQIELYQLSKPINRDGVSIHHGFVVPVRQRQYRLIKSLFEPVTEFGDNTFYDVSTWHFPAAYGLPFLRLEGKASRELTGDKVEQLAFPRPEHSMAEDAYAYLFEWTPYYAPRAAYQLLKNGVKLRFATKTFTADTRRGKKRFGHGTVLAPMGIQTLEPSRVMEELKRVSSESGVDVFAVSSGLTPEGIDLGSPSMEALPLPRVLLITGGRVSPYEAGEIWHLLDVRYDIPLTMVDTYRLGRVALHEYTHIVMVNGSYNDLNDQFVESLKAWVRGGGALIAIKRAVGWAIEKELIQERVLERSKPEEDSPESKERLPYGDRAQISALRRIAGSIFEARVDLTHPLGYGFERENISLFRTDTLMLHPSEDPYATVVRYNDEPLFSGYISPENLQRLGGSAAVIAGGVGRGAVILLADQPNFRGYWYGTNKLFLNGLFFSSAIQNTRNLSD